MPEVPATPFEPSVFGGFDPSQLDGGSSDDEEEDDYQGRTFRTPTRSGLPQEAQEVLNDLAQGLEAAAGFDPSTFLGISLDFLIGVGD